jgi:hypothetical protein
MNKGSNLDEQLLYEDCWNGKWGNVIFVNLEQWFDILAIFFSSFA